jgi:hypothetical protein
VIECLPIKCEAEFKTPVPPKIKKRKKVVGELLSEAGKNKTKIAKVLLKQYVGRPDVRGYLGSL